MYKSLDVSLLNRHETTTLRYSIDQYQHPKTMNYAQRVQAVRHVLRLGQSNW